MKVCYIFRTQTGKAHHSIENVFRTIACQMNDFHIETQLYYRHVSFWKTLKELRKIKADVYHITGDVHYLALFLSRKKTTITIHDIVGYKTNKNWLKSRVIALLWFILPIWWVKKITAISELTKKDLIDYFQISPDKIIVIENPISIKVARSPKELNSSYPTILQIGVGWHKNLGGLIEAVKGLPCHIDIVGNPDKSLIDQMIKYNVSYHIETNIPDQQVVEKYQQCDMVYFASFFEGFGLPIIEAQSVGRAVITSNISPMKDVAGDGAVLVNPHSVQEIRNGIENIINNHVYRDDLIQKGFTNAKRYAPHIIAAQYFQLYLDLNNRS